jgi:hypothetical protein
MKPEQIYLCGLWWDTENITDDYYTFDEANKIAEDNGKRLPTKEEFQKLSKLPHVWDDECKGMWFAEDEKDLKNPVKSLFLPAAGCCLSYGGVVNHSLVGYYWSCTPIDGIGWYHASFNRGTVYPYNDNYYTSNYTIRCVRK